MNGKITGVRRDSMICSTGQPYTKILPSFQTVITLRTLSARFLLQGFCYSRPRIDGNWYKIFVSLQPNCCRHTGSVHIVFASRAAAACVDSTVHNRHGSKVIT